MRRFYLVATALLVGSAAAAIPSILQPNFKAGSLPDGICELVLLPGKLIAGLFHDRGTASAEFLWRTRIATAVLVSGVAYVVLRYRKSQTKNKVTEFSSTPD
jgi:hypothetical protein